MDGVERFLNGNAANLIQMLANIIYILYKSYTHLHTNLITTRSNANPDVKTAQQSYRIMKFVFAPPQKTKRVMKSAQTLCTHHKACSKTIPESRTSRQTEPAIPYL